MDIRNPVLAMLCGGAPAPGINGVISSITIEALNSNCSVLGFFEGFRQLRQGKSMAMSIEFGDITRSYNTGGSMIRTSKYQLQTAAHVDNCLRVLQHHRVRYLVTIGGTQTAYSASLVVTAAAAAKYKISVVHVPKTIFNDVEGVGQTFGFSTAREVGMQLVQNFANDARTMQRWYLLVCMGQKAGHLTLGISKAGAATVTIIPEDYLSRSNPLTFSELATVLEAAIYKRRAMNKEYGVACISEGLVSCLDQKELTDRFGDLDTAHSELGRHLTIELLKRFAKRGIEQTVVSRNIGNELRAAAPNASDITLTRDLGFAATRVLMDGGNNVLVTLKSGQIHVIPLSSILDASHSSTQIRRVDTDSLSYQVAQSYSIMLRQPDLQDTGFLQKLARSANMTASEFMLAFQSVAAPMPSYRHPQTAGISYEFMQQAFPQLPGGLFPGAAAPTTSEMKSGALTQQTKSQLLAQPTPSPTHIVSAGQPLRKGSDREASSASPPGHGHPMNQQQQPQQANSGGAASGHQLSAHPVGGHSRTSSDALLGSASSSNNPSAHTAAALAKAEGSNWFANAAMASAAGFSEKLANQSARMSASSPTPPLHMLTNPETPVPAAAQTSGGTPRGSMRDFPTPSSLATAAALLSASSAASGANLVPSAVTPHTGAQPKSSPVRERRGSFEFKL
jgi:6-phosphofructokinase